MVIRQIILAVALSAAFPAMAQVAANPFVDQLLADLQAQGYDEIEVKRSWLGRIIIEAESGDREREIVLNPHTGEILRDIFEYEDDALIGGREPRAPHETIGQFIAESGLDALADAS